MNGYLLFGIACGLILFGFICYLIGTRRGYTLRDNELNEVARLQRPTREYADTLVSVPLVRKAAPEPEWLDQIAAKVVDALATAVPEPGHDIRQALYRLPRPVGHRGDVVEADVLEWTGRHSVAVQQGLALQRALSASTAEYEVVATTEPPLLCLPDGEPVADEDWGYPGLGRELVSVG